MTRQSFCAVSGQRARPGTVVCVFFDLGAARCVPFARASRHSFHQSEHCVSVLPDQDHALGMWWNCIGAFSTRGRSTCGSTRKCTGRQTTSTASEVCDQPASQRTKNPRATMDVRLTRRRSARQMNVTRTRTQQCTRALSPTRHVVDRPATAKGLPPPAADLCESRDRRVI